MTNLTATALICTLKPGDAASSSELMAGHILAELGGHGVESESIRVVDHDVKPGVEPDMGPGDAWPGIRERILASDILVVATPIWLGQMSSVAKRVLERLNAESAETDADGRMTTLDRVAVAGIVGNEDGAHKVTADLFQGLNDCGFTIPSQGATYWTGEAMGGIDYNDLDEVPESVAATTATLARNAAHLARILRDHRYPAGG